MKKKLLALFSSIAIGAMAVGGALAFSERPKPESIPPMQQQNPLGEPQEKYVKDRFLLKFKEGTPENVRRDVFQRHSLEVIRHLKALDVYVVKVPQGRAVEEMVRVLSQEPSVKWADFDYIMKTQQTSINDPLINYQGGLKETRFITAIKKFGHLGQDVAVMVVDTGVNINHEDLRDNIWINTGEIAGDGIDNDNNGYVDDVNGVNVIDYNGDITDTYGHGTAVAGIIGAKIGNGVGVIGTVPKVKIVGCKHAYSTRASNTLACFDYAIQKGIKVINLSWGYGGVYSDWINAWVDAIRTLKNNNIFLVAGAGNEGVDISQSTYPYPNYLKASYPDLTNLIGVAGTAGESLYYSSNYSKDYIEVSAPWGAFTTSYSGYYTYFLAPLLPHLMFQDL